MTALASPPSTDRAPIEPPWTDPDLPTSAFLYGRKGPWPQPAPDYPMTRPPEVLNIPSEEATAWDLMIGARLAATYAAERLLAPIQAPATLQLPLPSDDEFVRTMTQTVYARYLRPDPTDPACSVSDFTAMERITPLAGMYCAPVTCRFRKSGGGFSCDSITFLPTSGRSAALVVHPGDKAWNLAKVYACQGAAYHALFVVHPALHFPMDSVNAITKTAVPQSHPLFQALFPHTTYTLKLDNAVLEGAGSIVNNDPQDTPYDPLTAKGSDLKQLFAAGYAGYRQLPAYPRYDFMQPWMDASTTYGTCLGLYFAPFMAFAKQIAAIIPATDPYTARWADYCSAQVQGFPNAATIFEGDKLAKAIAIYLWDVTVAHGADHYSFAYDVAVKDRFLRIRQAPPLTVDDGGDVQKVGDVANIDDMTRAEMAHAIFFKVVTLAPNLIDTSYAFVEPALQQAVDRFHADLKSTDTAVRQLMPNFMPLLPKDGDPLSSFWTIPASIQF